IFDLGLRDKKALAPSIKALGPLAKKIKFVLSEHREDDFKSNDVIVVNPAVPRDSRYLAVARKYGKTIVNDARSFFDAVPSPVIAVTGTRGKTTTVNWTSFILNTGGKKAILGGNSSDVALLNLAGKLKQDTTAVVELSSWQLELLPGAKRAPGIAVVTNLYPDHLNRYGGMKDYALAKAGIFGGQKRAQALVLNADNGWTRFFLSRKPRSKIYFFSARSLPDGKQGVFTKNGALFFRTNGGTEEVISAGAMEPLKEKGEHNLANFMAAALASHLAGVAWANIARTIHDLPDIKYREEVVLRKNGRSVVNDSAATSPDATVAAIRRFSRQGRIILITGGTDKNLDFKPLAREIKKMLPPEQVCFLNGSATQKLIAELRKTDFKVPSRQIFEALPDILVAIKNSEYRIENRGSGAQKRRPSIRHSQFTVLFSPGAASFEKFKNEFDRGERFNLYSQKLFKKI
ncbi:UDP-N-acetylmuramoyl-L-alanine--D-glutamate ligase, partial [Patescibacteria group bacterium]|nr:UDP-N-acetylmuramoyl-L-alanine--D-glutamate ligase [Patescibacteria group bacterium]